MIIKDSKLSIWLFNLLIEEDVAGTPELDSWSPSRLVALFLAAIGHPEVLQHIHTCIMSLVVIGMQSVK